MHPCLIEDVEFDLPEGRSDAAVFIQGSERDGKKARELSRTQSHKADSLRKIYKELCSEEYKFANWDKEGALSLKDQTIDNALIVLSNLPQHINLPDVFVEPDGSIGMDWETPLGSLGSSIDENRRLSYAFVGKDGEELFGSGVLRDRLLPKRFLSILKDMTVLIGYEN